MVAVAITRTDLTATERRGAAARSRDAQAARRMLARALVFRGPDRTTAATTCCMDRQSLSSGGLETVPGPVSPPIGYIDTTPTAWQGLRTARVQAGRAESTRTMLPILQAGLRRAPIRCGTGSQAGGGRT